MVILMYAGSAFDGGEKHARNGFPALCSSCDSEMCCQHSLQYLIARTLILLENPAAVPTKFLHGNS